MSNALGTINPVERDRRACAHARGVPVLLDGSQAAYHLPVDVQALDCDFYVATGHKLYGPTGIGVLYGKAAHARGDAAVPGRRRHDQLGHVREDRPGTSLPHKFEAGTPDIARRDRPRRRDRLHPTAIGLDADRASTSAICSTYAHRGAARRSPACASIGTARRKASILSFVLDGVHPHDIGTIVDREGVAVRTGHHCAQPVMDRFGIPATARASLAMYNTREEIDALVRGARSAGAEESVSLVMSI